MRLLLLFFIAALVVCETYAASERCYEKIEECHTTNYQEYVNCIRRRQKRSTDCDSSCDSNNCINTCNECDCDSCGYTSCQNSCNSCCSSCCNNYNTCTNNHCCHKTCHAQCRSSSCRSSCRKTCYDRIRDMDEQTASNIQTNSSNINDNKHNITTIIHLNNIINNTNIIDIPILLNNTNHNNITLNQNGYGSSSNINGTNNCCTVISPRQCERQKEPPYVKCFHYRSRQCGAYCTAPIVHKEQQQICESTYPGSAPSCYQSVMYIPQPQPRCSYQSTWPYVSCGVPRSVSCAGCYNHYVNQQATNFATCPGACYDDGYGIGPYYRQGPFYRPTYSHAPCSSCFAYGGYGVPSGGYPSFGGYGGGYPSFGGYGGGYPPFAGYPSYGGYPPSFANGEASMQGQSVVPDGSWAPPVENPFDQTNSSNFEPLINVDHPMPVFQEPYRVTRELEIELHVDKEPSAQAEVKIVQPDESEVEKDLDVSDKKGQINSTAPSAMSKAA